MVLENRLNDYPMMCWTYYWFGERISDERVIEEWKGLGLNRPLSPRIDGKTDKLEFRAFLDKCAASGIRPIVHDMRLSSLEAIRSVSADGGAAYRSAVRQSLSEYGDHPAVSGFFVFDEPEADLASAAFHAARIQKEEAPELTPYFNLLPWFPWIGPRIGSDAYAPYLDRCARESGLGEIGYDCYAHMNPSDPGGADVYFYNLREWAAFGLRSGKHWNTTLLCTPHYSYEIKSADDFRWQISTAAAMGAKGLSWFYPDMHAGAHDNYREAPVNALGEHSDTFRWMGTEVRLFQRQFGAVFMDVNWQKSFVVGKSLGGLPEFTGDSDSAIPAVSAEHALVSFFADAEGCRYLALVNLDRASPKTMRVSFANGIEPQILAWRGWTPLATTYDPAAKESEASGTVNLHSAPGQLFLIRI